MPAVQVSEDSFTFEGHCHGPSPRQDDGDYRAAGEKVFLSASHPSHLFLLIMLTQLPTPLPQQRHLYRFRGGSLAADNLTTQLQPRSLVHSVAPPALTGIT